MGAKISKRYSYSFHLIWIKVVMGEQKVKNTLEICQKLKILWHFENFVDTEPYGLGISKHYFSYSFYQIGAKLYDK